jgi:hypothetical protein
MQIYELKDASSYCEARNLVQSLVMQSVLLSLVAYYGLVHFDPTWNGTQSDKQNLHSFGPILGLDQLKV